MRDELWIVDVQQSPGELNIFLLEINIFIITIEKSILQLPQYYFAIIFD